MFPDASYIRREDLFREIFDTIRQWPELERNVFSLAHYRAQSPDSISRSLLLDVEEVNSILRRCDRRLHESLKDYHESGCGGGPPAAAVAPAVRGQDLRLTRAIASRANGFRGARRIPA